MDLQRIRHRLTPLGAADRAIEEAFGAMDGAEQQRYERAASRYGRAKRLQDLFRLLFYASLITSAASALGIPQVQIIQAIHAYLGTTVTFLLFLVTGHVAAIRREQYYTQRSIRIAAAAAGQRSGG